MKRCTVFLLAVALLFIASLNASAAKLTVTSDELWGYDSDGDPVLLGTDTVWVSNDALKVGFSMPSGGAITYLSEVGSTVNLVDNRDIGRMIQQSYYANWLPSELPQSWYAWNPIQGGSALNGPYTQSTVNAFDVDADAGTIYMNITPALWHAANTLATATFEQWITFDGPLLTIRYKVTHTGTTARTEYQGSGASSIFAAEGPAAFFKIATPTFVTYNGSAPWTNDPVLDRSQTGFKAVSPAPTERWGARVGANDYGVGLYDASGDATMWYINNSTDYVYMAADINWTGGIHPGESKEFTRVFTVGNLSDIRQRFYNIHQPPPPLQKRPLKSSTGHGRISGKGGGRVSGKPS